MHMNSVPQHLHSEDRQEYERVLDEALRSAPHHPELAGIGRRLNPEQLRTMALGATAFITAAAATEYQHYTKVREELRHPAPSASCEPDAGEPTVGADFAAGLGEAAGEPAGAGAVAAVLTPVLAGTAAVIFLLVGYLLKALNPAPAFADALVTVGWVFGVVTALAILVATVGLLLTALRNRPAVAAGPYNEQAEEVARAREAWRTALLERGFLPYFREALTAQDTDPAATVPPTAAPPSSRSRLPKIGYDRPGFTSPDDGPAPGHRPSFSSPDYTSPDFGGPDNTPD